MVRLRADITERKRLEEELYPRDAADVSTLIRMADLAMYRSKQLGRNAVQFYAPELESPAME